MTHPGYGVAEIDLSRQTIVQHRYNVHGQSVVVESAVESIEPLLARSLGAFEERSLPEGFARIHGAIVPYDEGEVLRSLSPSAQLLSQANPLIEIYRDDERYWLIDDRWGICELNALRATFRTWIVDHPVIDRQSALELGILWAIAQLMRTRGLFMIPGIGIARAEFGMLMLSPYPIEGEVRELVAAGFAVIGQSWVCLREEDGRVAMLQMPGLMQRTNDPLIWTDLTNEFPGSSRHHAFITSVAIIEPVRRSAVEVRATLRTQALPKLRRAWPIHELSQARRSRQILPRLAQSARCFGVQLARDPKAILRHLDTLRDGGAIAA